MRKMFLTVLFLLLFFYAPVLAEEQSSNSPSLIDRVGDALCIRSLGFVRVIIEAVAYGVSLPIIAPLGKVDEAREFLITDPYAFTFERPLGEM